MKSPNIHSPRPPHLAPLRLLIPLLLLLPFTTCVDQSKFRTCQQTSFCRRHRHRKPRHHFRLDPTSLQFILSPSSSTDGAAAAAPAKTGRGLMSRFFGGKSGDADATEDVYVRGPAPVLEGSLSNGRERLMLAVYFQDSGVSRVRITEEGVVRWTSDDVVLNLEEMAMASSVEYLEGEALTPFLDEGGDVSNYRGLKSGDVTVLLKLMPFAMSVFVKGESIMSVNAKQLMHFEQKRDPTTREKRKLSAEDAADGASKKHEKEIVGYWEDGLAIYADGTREERSDNEKEEELKRLRELEELESSEEEDEDGLWEEKFQSHSDSKPNGPMSVGIDVTFPSRHLYGLPEHASSTLLQTTEGEGSKYKEPYRLYNLDVFEYDLDTTMALYGSVPIIVSNNGKHSVGLFYFNPTETFVDVLTDDEESTTAHFISESGVLDLFFLPGPTPSSVFSQYATITGRTPLPPLFALGYHQCRWNYRDEKDVYQVHDQFEEYDYPYDVLWLDIEHTNDKRYFTWNYDLFPTPKAMQNKLASQGRKMVTIVDPHIKRDDKYYIHKTATSKGYYIKKQDGTDYDGWCWPGSSSYLDFTSDKVRDWFASQFAYDIYKESTPTLHTWNDMNEPSVFNGPEVSMQKDLLNLAGVEHREWHNLYGMLFQRATHEGLIKRNRSATKERGFVLSRAFFAGSQRYGAIWTGDNAAEWSHLAIATPMLLSLNIGGIFFSGADVGGFFKETSAELMTRWMQAGAYQPFFRGHAHHDTKRKEPWVYGDETLKRLRKVALERYALLPYWYTVFRHAMTTGMPVMRTLWMEYPNETSLFHVDDQYFVGGALMVKPVTEEAASDIPILFPLADLWYDVHTLAKVQLDKARDNAGVQEITIPTSIDEIPVYQRGGTIVPRKLRLRRSSSLMTHDPYTLYIALTETATAQGEVYIDDEHTFDYEKGNYCLSTITADFNHGKYIRSRVEKGDTWKHHDGVGLVERIVVMGLEKRPKMVSVGKKETSFVYNDDTAVLVIKLPNVHVTLDWDMSLLF
eukprot:CAMPEP_0172503312 /NCGR_PEP_ID=MMETSP1066-20121228/168103_1 /TAXON_ID=671091 /ORGANISM="Coscinodiscus wailesii, Strain CCMP2513" /LENGTH=1025 /DNA_ID=CAMNT_0013278997 /DNA_START=155 /DNA_END=3232 /DNA_ORIENTATION=+